jgi:hypothetical protein
MPLTRDLRAFWLIVPAPAIAVVVTLLASAAAPGADADAIRRVVVIHLDTTRADDLGCNGGIASTS